MIPDEVVDQVRDAADIVEVIGEHVNLKRVGSDFRGPCPFHQGTHRNFSVFPKTGRYYCFVCHEGGDVFWFLHQRLGIEWPEAVKQLGARYGVTVVDSSVGRSGPDPRESLWELNAVVADYYERVLWDEPLASEAREYLANREITREHAEQFGLGFAPREIGLMRTYMNSLGFEDARLMGAGLLVSDGEGKEPRPRFRGRLIFPILDQRGHTVGFGGRLLTQGEPKYLNSPESAVFSKGKTLYGLNWAKSHIAREDRAFIVEGYFDLIRLALAGIKSVVAPLGTALTAAQAALLRKVPNVFLLYDSDKAGLKATFKAGDELLKERISVRVVTLPEGYDPDTFVRKFGSEGLEQVVSDAVDVFERKMQILERGGWFADLHKKRRALDRLLPTLRATTDPITRDLYLSRASVASGVARRILERELGIKPDHPSAEFGQLPDQNAQNPAYFRSSERRKPTGGSTSSAERELVRVMLTSRNFVERISEKISPRDFQDERLSAIYEALLRAGPDATVEALSANLPDAAMHVVEGLLAESGGYVFPERTVNDSLAELAARKIEQRLMEIDEEARLASPSELDKLIAEKQELMKEFRGTGRVLHFKAFRKQEMR